MGGSAIRRELQQDEKVVVTFEIWGPVTPQDANTFTTDFRTLIMNKGIRLHSEEEQRQPGDPNSQWP
jgi:hypothetical protein